MTEILLYIITLFLAVQFVLVYLAQRRMTQSDKVSTVVDKLNRILVNDKVRGNWGEGQLETLLGQFLTTDQYEKQFELGANAKVDFVIHLPCVGDERILLPIDSKFPTKSFEQLLDADKSCDIKQFNKAIKDLRSDVIKQAADIKKYYVKPPKTTAYAIMFLPSEALYAEVLQQRGIVQELYNKHQIILAGPTTLVAIVNTVLMIFYRHDIGRNPNKVWQVLSAVNTEFDKFCVWMDKIKKQANTLFNSIEEMDTRTRALKRELKDVARLPINNDPKVSTKPTHSEEVDSQ